MRKKSIILRFSIIVALLAFCSGSAFATDEPMTEHTDESLAVETTAPEMCSQDMADPDTPVYSDANNHWKPDASGKYRYCYEGMYLSQAVYLIDGEYYAFDENGYMVADNWYDMENVNSGKNWYYAKADGRLARSEWIGDHYFNKDGKMATSEWIEDRTGERYYVGADGKYAKAQWKHDSKGWWYQFSDGTYARDEVRMIDNAFYAFDYNGYMLVSTWYSETFLDEQDVPYDVWYYAKADGRLAEDVWLDNYYFNSKCEMQTSSWIWDVRSNREFYVGKDGKYVPDKWVHDSKGWKCLRGDGFYAQNNIFSLDGKLYAFDNKGYCVSKKGWCCLNHYFVDGTISPVWCYVQADGTLVHSRWLDNYYFEESGRLQTSTWIWDGSADEPYYVDKNGKYSVGKWVKDSKGWRYNLEEGKYCNNGVYPINGKIYVFDEKGYLMSDSWTANHKHYANADGTCATNQWIGNEYLDKYGQVCYNQFIDGYWIDFKGDSESERSGSWKKDRKGWWYQVGDEVSSYPKDSLVGIDQKVYYFDKNGYMISSRWHYEQGIWFYAKADGSLATDEWVGDYYFYNDGSLATDDWILYNGHYYYVDKNGKWDPSAKR